MAPLVYSAYIHIVAIVVNVVVVALRTWTRLLAKTPWQYADILIPLSLVFILILASLFLGTRRFRLLFLIHE
jgi:hypothetical protein